IPFPVIRIAPKPSRLTVRSPPSCQVGFVAGFIVVEEVAPKIASDPPAKSVAPPARVVSRNVRRVTRGFCFGSTDSSAMTRGNYVHGNRRQRKRTLPPRRAGAAVVSAALSQYRTFRRN